MYGSDRAAASCRRGYWGWAACAWVTSSTCRLLNRRNRADTSVILIWLSGGPGHMETWDPKPDAPREFRGPLRAIRTTLPGVHVGELMPCQASIMRHLAILRTVNHGSGDHTKSNHWMLTGFEGPAFNAPTSWCSAARRLAPSPPVCAAPIVLGCRPMQQYHTCEGARTTFSTTPLTWGVVRIHL